MDTQRLNGFGNITCLAHGFGHHQWYGRGKKRKEAIATSISHTRGFSIPVVVMVE
jgi:hypothetical protein